MKSFDRESQDFPSDLKLCDNHLLVLIKPAGMLTQPDESSSPSLQEKGKKWIKKHFEKPGNVFLEPIHRLDKPVSGIVLFARTSKALSRLQAMMRERQIRKTYYAWVEGHVVKEEALLEHFLTHDSHCARVVTATHPEAKKAVLAYRVVERGDKGTLLEIDLHTGRYHQIRAQLAAIGHPVIGDQKYGSKRLIEGGRILLHHGKLECKHPVTQLSLILEDRPSFLSFQNF